ADRNRSHWSTSKTPSYTKSVSWQHHHIHQINIKKNRKTYNSIQIIRIGFATRAFCPLFPR
ncbi:hypothetical protein, partial [Escherichia coli]|uniref:hypothetical protein n=1 Tax=Escherichia coli TaxID=562 RepID=UPI004068365A